MNMPNPFNIQVDTNAAAAAEESSNRGSDGFPPLPQGKYQAFVEKFIEVQPFTKDERSGNFGKQAARFQLKIVSDSPIGAGRVYFLRVPLFTRYAPSQKSPEGAPAGMYFDFFGEVAGATRDQLIAGQVPSPTEIGGKRLTITLSAPIKPDAYNPKGSNEVSFVGKEGDINATPKTKVVVPWLDDHGNVNPGWEPTAAGQAPAPAAQQAPPAYGGAPAAAPSAPPAYAAPAAPAAPAPAAAAPAAPAYAPPAAAQAAPPAWHPGAEAVQQAAAAAAAGTGY